MGFLIKCSDINCNKTTWAINIVDLISNYRDDKGWFLGSCGHRGYVEKRFDLQEEGEVWEPFLQGIITLGDEGATYQPFVFKVSYTPAGNSDSLWFSYYKDLRAEGGRLKLGYGPGGPPVLHKDTLKNLFKQLLDRNILSKEDLLELIE